MAAKFYTGTPFSGSLKLCDSDATTTGHGKRATAGPAAASRCDSLTKEDTMADGRMFNDTMTSTERPRPNGALMKLALKHCTAQNQVRHRIVSQPLSRSPYQNLISIFIVATSLCLLGVSAPAQSPSQTQSETRQQLLKQIDSGQLREAVILGQQAVSHWPRDAQLRHYLGVAYFKTGDSKQAQEQLTRARDLNPNDSATHFDLALVLLGKQAYPGAADELEASIKLNPSNALAHVFLGRAYLNSNRSLQAIDEFKTALKLDPAIKLGHYHLGFAYFSLGRNEEAITEYKEEVRRSGENPAVIYALGHSLLASGKYEEAVTNLQRGTELAPRDPDVWYDLGKAQALAGQSAQAEPSLRKSAELNPKDPSPHYQLARLLDKLGKTEEAKSERDRFAELKKAQPASAGMATGRDQ
jgi:tetratricopeptide (TPR) repeat protein